MNRIALYVIAILVAVTLLVFTCTFQVRFNETAIVTTFRKVTKQVHEPGLHFKWPYPIQAVRHYDSRAQILESRLENVMTRDNQLVVAQIFLTWRIADADKFYRRITSEQQASQRLEERLRSALGVFSRYDFHDLLTVGPEASKLGEVEERIFDLLVNPADETESVLAAYGVQPLAVGISRFILPEKTSEQVFQRMQETRNRLAADIRYSGEAEATRIMSQADADAQMIESFARRRAQAIRALGDFEAARYARELATDENLAVYLLQLRALESIISKDTTVILPGRSPFDLLIAPPVRLAPAPAPLPEARAEPALETGEGG